MSTKNLYTVKERLSVEIESKWADVFRIIDEIKTYQNASRIVTELIAERMEDADRESGSATEGVYKPSICPHGSTVDACKICFSWSR